VESAAPGPGEAAGRAWRTGSIAWPSGRPDFIVLVWYHRAQALGTFQYQLYDVRKGEYTPAVDAWVRETRARYPDYVVTARAVDLSREKGETEMLRVGSVVHRELLAAAARAGVFPGPAFNVSPGPATSTPSPVQPGNRMAAPDRSFLQGSPAPSIPVYPRTRAP
jgi:hypothetical protein